MTKEEFTKKMQQLTSLLNQEKEKQDALQQTRNKLLASKYKEMYVEMLELHATYIEYSNIIGIDLRIPLELETAIFDVCILFSENGIYIGGIEDNELREDECYLLEDEYERPSDKSFHRLDASFSSLICEWNDIKEKFKNSFYSIILKEAQYRIGDEQENIKALNDLISSMQ